MKTTILIILILVLNSFYSHAQKNCMVKSGKAFYYEVISGVNNTTIDIMGNESSNNTSPNLNTSIYFVTNCAQTPIISYSIINKQKMKIEFIKIPSGRDEIGYDTNGEIKVIKATRGTFLWKANSPLNIKHFVGGKAHILIKGIIGGKKFTYIIKSIQKLQPLAMY